MGSERERRRRFDALFASYSSDIFAYCGWRAGSPSDAQDAAAEVFLTAWRRLDELPEGDAERITHNGKLWAGTTIRWYDRDVAVSRDAPQRNGKVGSRFLVVDGTLYGLDVTGGWVKLGNPENIDPDSGTTPDEYLAAVREDIGGVTLHRMVDGMTGLTTRRLGDGSTSSWTGSTCSGCRWGRRWRWRARCGTPNASDA